MRVAFFGLPLAALMLHRRGHSIVHAALCRRGAPGERRLRRLLGDDVVRVAPKVDRRYAATVRAARAELLVSWFWTKKLPIEVVEAAPLGGVGVHPSLLPRWRGPDPTFWAIDAGDRETGVTAHRIAADYDTGAIVAQRRLTIDPRWDSWALARALDRPSLALLGEVVDVAARDGRLDERAQDEALVTEAPAPTDELLALSFDRPTARVLRRIRAAAPYPGAWTFIGDEAVVLTRAEPHDERPKMLAPGEAMVHRGRAIIATADGAIVALAGRLVGEDDDEAPLAHDHERVLDAHGLAELVTRAREGT
jgi:methionyl-tRNA formyltransferase